MIRGGGKPQGGRIKTKGWHYQAAQAIQEYIEKVGIECGPLFRPRSSSKGEQLADRRMTVRSMSRLISAYLGAIARFRSGD